MIFDTGTTLIVTDTSSNFNSIYYILSELYGNCQIVQGLIECSCKNATSLIGLNFTINNVVLTVPSNRLWDYDDGVCTLLVMASNQGFWILGDVLLQNYYTIYDMDKLTVSFAPSINSNYTPPLPDYENSPFLVLDAVIALVLFSL